MNTIQEMQTIHAVHAPGQWRKPAYRWGLLFLLLFVFLIEAQAQSRVATTAAQFLTLGTGARGASLGHAYTATVKGPDAVFWNPAGLGVPYDGERKGGLFFSNMQWLADINYNAFSLALPITTNGVMGASIGMVDYGRQDVRTVDQPEGVGQTFGANDLVVALSYAQPLTDAFVIGGSVKTIRQSIWDSAAQTYAVDIGFVLNTNYFNGMRIAASIMNFGGKMQMGGINNQVFVDFDPTSTGSNDALPARLETSAWDLPLAFRFGLALPVYTTSFASLELYSDAHQTNDNNLNTDLGAQLRLMVRKANLDVRAGYKDLGIEDIDNHLSLGAGLDLIVSGFRVGFDYAYIPFDLLGEVQLLDLRFYF